MGSKFQTTTVSQSRVLPRVLQYYSLEYYSVAVSSTTVDRSPEYYSAAVLNIIVSQYSRLRHCSTLDYDTTVL